MIHGNYNSQELTKKILSSTNDQIFSLSGPSYVGKMSFISEWARSTVQEPDILITDKSIDGARQAGSFSRHSPSFSKYKVIIIDNAQDLTESAQDAYLNVCESPPDYVRLFFVSDDNDALLSSLKSRIQHTINFGRLSSSEIEEFANADSLSPDTDAMALCSGRPGLYRTIASSPSLKSFYKEIKNLFKDGVDILGFPVPSILSDMDDDKKREAVFVICTSAIRELLHDGKDRQQVGRLSEFASILKKIPSANPDIHWQNLVLSFLV